MTFNITNSYPSSILPDFHNYLEYIERHNCKLTKARKHLSRKDLELLNQSMSVPHELTGKQKDQFQYPMLHLFYHLTIDGELAIIRIKSKSNIRLEPTTEKLSYFRSLNATEQYFYLFKTLFQYVDYDSLRADDRGAWLTPNPGPVLAFAATANPDRWINVGERKRLLFLNTSELVNHFSRFGFWEARFESLYGGARGLILSKTKVAPIGKAMSGVIAEKAEPFEWNSYLQFSYAAGSFFVEDEDDSEESTEPETPVRDLEDLFRHLFPEGALGKVDVKSSLVYREGNYIFKVALKYDPEIWRSIQMTDKHTLDDLHLAIQMAFNFGNDHLYSFFPDGKKYSKIAYHDPRASDGFSADEITLGEMPLQENQIMLYLFDYGDTWLFDVQLEKIEERSTKKQPKPKLLESNGESPEQYPYYDEDEY